MSVLVDSCFNIGFTKMPIKVACQCGASFAAKDELAGKAVRCPKCKSPLKVPAAPAAAAPQTSDLDDLFDEVGLERKSGPTCPKCGTELKPNAVLCVGCGLNLQTGEQARGFMVQTRSKEGYGEAADSLLKRAEQQIGIDKVEEKKNRASGAPFYVYLFALLLLIGFAMMMFTMDDRRQAFYWSGQALILFAGVIMAYYQIRIAIIAFQESVGQGLMYVFVPFYFIVYWILRWNQVNKFAMPFITTGILGQGVGWFFTMLSVVLPPPEDDEAWRWQPAAVPVVIVEDGPQRELWQAARLLPELDGQQLDGFDPAAVASRGFGFPRPNGVRGGSV